MHITSTADNEMVTTTKGSTQKYNIVGNCLDAVCSVKQPLTDRNY